MSSELGAERKHRIAAGGAWSLTKVRSRWIAESDDH
jgi:hypothetical protein